MDTSTLIVPAVAIIIVIAWAGYIYGKKRGEAFRRFSRHRGLAYSKNPDLNIEDEFRSLPFFSEGTDRKWTNLIKGETDGAYVMLFDYSSVTGTGPSKTTINQTVLVLRSGKVNMPSFQMYPRNIFGRIFSRSAAPAISFQTNTGFSEAYEIKGIDDHALKTVFADQVLPYFATHRGLYIEGSGQRLLIYNYGTLIKPDEIPTFLDRGIEILRLFEGHSVRYNGRTL